MVRPVSLVAASAYKDSMPPSPSPGEHRACVAHGRLGGGRGVGEREEAQQQHQERQTKPLFLRHAHRSVASSSHTYAALMLWLMLCAVHERLGSK